MVALGCGASGCIATCPSDSPPAVWGSVPIGQALQEISGIAPSSDGRFWVHDDGDLGGSVYEIERGGDVRSSVPLGDVGVVDAEDIATVPAGGDGVREVVLADIGDNEQVRDNVQLFSFAEPAGSQNTPLVSLLTMRYDDGEARDAEAFMVDPRDGRRFVWSKARGTPELFSAASGGIERTLERVDVDFQLDPEDWGVGVTGADISPDRRWIIARSLSHAWLWPLGGRTVERALSGEVCVVELVDEPQGEAVTFWEGGWVTISEGAGAYLYAYSW